jgi:hypothetical protein
MRLILRLGIDISSSESSEGIISPGYDNVVVLSWLLVKRFGKDLHSLISDFLRLLLCILVILPVTH